MELFEEKNAAETSAQQSDMRTSPSFFSDIPSQEKIIQVFCVQPLAWTRREREIPLYCITEI